MLDEVQRVPDLSSWIQSIFDESRPADQSVLTASGDFLVALRRVEATLKIPVTRRMLVFGGQGSHVRAAVEVVGMGD